MSTALSLFLLFIYCFSSTLSLFPLNCSPRTWDQDDEEQQKKRNNFSKTVTWKTNLLRSTWRPYCLPLFVRSGQFGEWLKLFLIHSTSAGEFSSRSDALERPNNQYLSYYSQSDLRKILWMRGCYNIFKICTCMCDSLNDFTWWLFCPCPFTWNRIPSLLMH